MRLRAITLLTAAVLGATSAPAWAGDGNQYFVANENASGYADLTFKYGTADDVVVIGDWDGDGQDTIAVRRGATYYISNVLRSGNAEKVVTFGTSTDVVIAGDWDGDGADGLAIRRGDTLHFDDDLDGRTDRTATFSGLGGEVFGMRMQAGSVERVASRRNGNQYCIWPVNGGSAERCFRYGTSTDVTYVADWDANGTDTVVVRRGNTYYVKNDYLSGYADYAFKYGSAKDVVHAGDWDADGLDTLMVRRNAVVRPGTGELRVGADISAGLWKSTTGGGGYCYWERAADHSDTLDSIIANDFVTHGGPVIVRVLPTDAEFQVEGCRVWERIYATDSMPTTRRPGPGHYRVNTELEPGTYVTTVPSGSDGCYWEVVSDFTGEFEDIIINGYHESGQVIVEIYPDEAGFYSVGCGVWQPA